MHSIFTSLFPLIVLIAMGYALKQCRFLQEGFWLGAEKLNYYVLFPAMLFYQLSSAELHADLVSHLLLLLSLMLSIVVGCLYLAKSLFKIRSARHGVFIQSNIRFNTYMGLAIVASLFEQQGMVIFALLIALSIPAVNVISVIALTQQGTMQIKLITISLLKNPLIVSCVLGVLYNLSGVGLWDGVGQLLKQLATASLPLGLLCVGAALQFKALQHDLHVILLHSVSKLLIIPFLAWTLAQGLNIADIEMQVLVLFFALPTASASYILTKVLGGDHQLMAGIISVQTLFCAFSLPLILHWVML